MKHVFAVRVGAASFRVGSDWPQPVRLLRDLYRDYPAPDGGIADYSVRLFARRPWRRVVRPSVEIGGDYTIPDAAPLPLRHGLLAAEMAMNLQMALGQRRFLLLHAACVEKDGRAALLTGLSGSGKSTLAALLMAGGWRLLGDEFVLLDPETGLCRPFPRLVSLKQHSIAVMEAALPDARFGPRLVATPKGDLRHLVPDARAIEGMDRPARSALILFPAFGHAADVRPVAPAEAFVRLTQASTNYPMLGARGFDALTALVTTVRSAAIDYPDTATALALVDRLWREVA